MDEKSKPILQTISLDELEKIGLVTTDIYSILGQSKKEVTLLRAGEYVLPSFIDKYRVKGIKSFYVKHIFDPKENEFWKNLWGNISKCQESHGIHEFEIYKVRKEFIKNCKQVFFDGTTSSSLLSYTSATHQHFIGLSSDFMSQYAEKNYLLFKRSMLVASLSLPIIISFGYSEQSLLKDIYNISLLLSYHLANEKFTITVKNALSLENMERGLGIKYLQLKSPAEINHISKMDEVEQVSNIAYSYHHEQIKDLIYLYQLIIDKNNETSIFLERDLPDWASAVVFMDKLIPYDDLDFKLNDACKFLKEKIEKKFDERFTNSYGFKKLKNVLTSFWEVELNMKKMSA